MEIIRQLLVKSAFCHKLSKMAKLLRALTVQAYAHFDIYLPEASVVYNHVVAVRVMHLRSSHFPLSDIRTNNGALILTAGNRVPQMVIGKLANYAAVSGIQEPIY